RPPAEIPSAPPAPTSPTPPTTANTPTQAPPPVVSPPTPEVQAPVEATPPPATPPVAEPPPDRRTEPPPSASAAPPPERADTSGLALLHWLTLLVAAGLLFQVVNLALRPLRRWIVLRHLRRPFWDETVDQRASNSWQLALVGLRDAGWRATSGEAPREF